MVGQFHSSVTAAVQVLAEQFKVPVFLTQASAKSLTEKHLNYTFRTHVIDPDRVTMWNRWIKERGYKRVAIMAENTDYGIGLVEDTKKTFGVAVPGPSSRRSSSIARWSISRPSCSRSRTGSRTCCSTSGSARRCT